MSRWFIYIPLYLVALGLILIPTTSGDILDKIGISICFAIVGHNLGYVQYHKRKVE